jgi:hypothetical protein
MVLILPQPLAQRLTRTDATLLSLKIGLAYHVGLAGTLDPSIYKPPTRRSTCITIFKPKERRWFESLMIGMFRMGSSVVSE